MATRFAARPDPGSIPPYPLVSSDPIGRDAEIRRLLEAVTAPSGPPVVLLRGEVGAGRTTVLDALGHRLRAARTPTYQVRCLPGERLTPGLLAHRLLLALAVPPPAPLAAGHSAERASPLTGPCPGASDSGTTSCPARLAEALRAHGPAVLLVDDAQHADPETVRSLHSLLSELPSVRLVLGVTGIGCPDGTAGTVDLPPLTRDDLIPLLALRLRAVPDDVLVDEVHRLSAGNPAAAVAAVGPEGPGTVRVLIGRAHLVEGEPPPPLPPANDRFTATLRELGDPVWRTARALSLLEPLPDRTAELIATATGLSRPTVDEALERLVQCGLVTGPGRNADAGWRFRIPLVALTVRARVGPYERRVVSAVAVQAHWEAADRTTGETRYDQSAYDIWLAERLVDAGGQVSRQRAARELFGVVERLRDTHPRQAARWLTTAVEWSDDEPRSASAVLDHVLNARRKSEVRTFDENVWAMLRTFSGQLDPFVRQSLLSTEMAQLAEGGDMAELAARYRVSATDPGARPFIPAMRAAALLGLWSDIPRLIDVSEAGRHPVPLERFVGRLARAAVQLMAGDPTGLQQLARTLPPEFPFCAEDFASTAAMFDALLLAEDTQAVTALLTECEATVDRLPQQTAVLHRFLTGAWTEALDTAGSLMANTRPTALGPVGMLIYAKASTALLARGWPSRAGTVLDIAHTAGSPMVYMLAAEQAAVHRFFGRTDAAREILCQGLAKAADGGCALGTAALWSELTLIEAERGRSDLVASGLCELRRIALTGRDSDRLTYLRTRVEARTADPDRADGVREAREALAVARSLGQPFELARTLLAVARAGQAADGGHTYGDAPAELLAEAYDLFGELDAPLWRHRTRAALRDADAGPAAPRDPVAAEETEVLLARLVSEGLSNRRLAEVLRVSETSVSTRLNRLYRHLGVRSRVELATAVVTGQYEPRPPRRLDS
ncbi:AAA family ATPase [Streptomyces sp. NPDC005474]|uniref:AAA family ATPase n=1 Tax=Streptomyces sp. NPDC005474 TaxID=3154878 RepID=UPI003456AF65